ncbi:MAG TPA: sialidase family protein [Luteitalea sp.]|nr:sialidase family protein [Luteitalea sp.]
MLLLVSLLLAATLTTPGTQPQVAHDGDRVVVTVARGDRIGVLRSTDAGRTFREATSIVPAGRMAAGMRRGPRVAVTSSTVIVSAVVGAQGGGKDGDIVVYRSTDQGTTWTTGTVVNDVPAAAREGMHGMAATPEGLVVVTWLDLRENGTRVYAAVSRDHGATWEPDVLAASSPDGAVCECCHPSVALDGHAIAILFRNHVGGARDLHVVRSSDGRTFTAPAKQGTGTWALQACPMDGGGLTLDPRGVTSAWRREDRVYLSSPLEPERFVAIGRDPVVAARAGGLALAWTTRDGVMLQRGSTTRLIGAGGFASIAAFRDHTLVAVEHGGQVTVHVVPRE